MFTRTLNTLKLWGPCLWWIVILLATCFISVQESTPLKWLLYKYYTLYTYFFATLFLIFYIEQVRLTSNLSFLLETIRFKWGMSCLWGWMNVGMNMDVWVRGRWRDLGRMEDGTTWKVSGQQHDDEQAWTDCIMIHFLRYPKGLGGTETKVRKCSNSNCPQLALTSRLHRCQFWNSWDDQQAASRARPTVQDHDWAAGCSSWWPLSSNPPCRATLGVALGSVTREALPCNMFPDWRGGALCPYTNAYVLCIVHF